MKLSRVEFVDPATPDRLKAWFDNRDGYGDYLKVLNPIKLLDEKEGSGYLYELGICDYDDDEDYVPVLNIFSDAGEASDDILSDGIGFIDKEGNVHNFDEFANFGVGYVPAWSAASNASLITDGLIKDYE